VDGSDDAVVSAVAVGLVSGAAGRELGGAIAMPGGVRGDAGVECLGEMSMTSFGVHDLAHDLVDDVIWIAGELVERAPNVDRAASE
jgi:hypothetical protein